MAEIDFYFAEEDLFVLANAAFEASCWLVPYLHYTSPAYEKIHTEEDLTSCLKRHPGLERPQQFFILSECFMRCPLEIGKIQRDGRVFYYIVPRSGGPTIHLFFPPTFERNGQAYIPEGSLSHYPSYWNGLTGEMEKPPEELRTIYKQLVRRLKTGAKVAKSTKRTFHVTANAQKLLGQGLKLGGVFRPQDVQ